MLYEQVIGAAALVVGAVLIWAGLPKAMRPGVFAAQIADYGIVPVGLTRFLARMVSSSELASGIMLLAGLFAPPWLRQVGAALAAALFMLFLGALGSAYARGRNIACACFGGSSTELETVGAHSIVRTALLLVLAAVAVFPASSGRPFVVGGLAVVLAALVALVSELTRLLGPLRRETAAILGQLTASPAVADQTGLPLPEAHPMAVR
ncbi:MAG TPA: MauE/DoxX family redox-associated membrane protein [Streptosporangiaceae bacterium]